MAASVLQGPSASPPVGVGSSWIPTPSSTNARTSRPASHTVAAMREPRPASSSSSTRCSGVSIPVVSQAYVGNEPSLSDALDFAFGKMGRTLAAGFASGIVTALAFILLIVPGIIVACGLSVAVQAAVLEPLPGGTDGLGRSWALTKGFRWRAFGLYVVVIVLLSLFLIGFGVIAGLAAALLPVLFVPALIGVGLIFLFFYPFTSCVFTLFYYDLRVRKEAFDLELLSQHLGITAARA